MKNVDKYIKVLIVLTVLLSISITFNLALLLFNINDNNKIDNLQKEINTIKTSKFQDKYSMDWDIDDEKYLLKMAVIENKDNLDNYLDYSRSILITLNRVFNDKYPNNIYNVCIDRCKELNISEEEFLNTKITNASLIGMEIVKDGFDDTNASIKY